MTRRGRWPALALGAALTVGLAPAAGCSTPNIVPGDDVLGSFLFQATVLERSCALAQVPVPEVLDAGFAFDATFSRDPATGDAWVSLRGYPRAASWDGQYAVSTAEARRVFSAPCDDCAMRVEESLHVAILSLSQSQAVGDTCPDDVFDGGVPAPDAQRGITPPQRTALGFDAVRACGVLRTTTRAGLKEDGGTCAAECDGCSMLYGLVGSRR